MAALSVRPAGSKLDGVQHLEEPLTLEEGAYKELRRVITDGILRPGDRVSINAIAQRMGVSRLPVIHALRRLASEGFVQIRPHRNAIVTKPTQKEIRVRILMMIALEEIAVREAWPLSPAALARMADVHELSMAHKGADEAVDASDWHFHEVIWQASGVEHLHDMIQTLWDLGAYYRTLMNRRHGVAQSRAVEHAAILHSFQTATLDEAVESIRFHRLKALDRLIHLFTEEAIQPNAPADGSGPADTGR
jgi:DNA-binding GntR family transcriptional regulator